MQKKLPRGRKNARAVGIDRSNPTNTTNKRKKGGRTAWETCAFGRPITPPPPPLALRHIYPGARAFCRGLSQPPAKDVVVRPTPQPVHGCIIIPITSLWLHTCIQHTPRPPLFSDPATRVPARVLCIDRRRRDEIHIQPSWRRRSTVWMEYYYYSHHISQSKKDSRRSLSFSHFPLSRPDLSSECWRCERMYSVHIGRVCP